LTKTRRRARCRRDADDADADAASSSRRADVASSAASIAETLPENRSSP
jgi:hypothetical protein